MVGRGFSTGAREVRETRLREGRIREVMQKGRWLEEERGWMRGEKIVGDIIS